MEDGPPPGLLMWKRADAGLFDGGGESACRNRDRSGKRQRWYSERKPTTSVSTIGSQGISFATRMGLILWGWENECSLAESDRPWEPAWGNGRAKTRKRRENSIDTPNTSRGLPSSVARIRVVQDEAEGRSMRSVEGVGEGIVVSTKRWGYVSGGFS